MNFRELVEQVLEAKFPNTASAPASQPSSWRKMVERQLAHSGWHLTPGKGYAGDDNDYYESDNSEHAIVVGLQDEDPETYFYQVVLKASDEGDELEYNAYENISDLLHDLKEVVRSF